MPSMQHKKILFHLFVIAQLISTYIQEIHGFIANASSNLAGAGTRAGIPTFLTVEQKDEPRSRPTSTTLLWSTYERSLETNNVFFFATEVTPAEPPPSSSNNNAYANINSSADVLENTIISVEEIHEEINNAVKTTEELWSEVEPQIIQGKSLKSCSFYEDVDRIEVVMRTLGRPLNADVELWQGPDNTPQKLSIYLEDGGVRTFRAMIESPGDSTSVIAVRNTGDYQYPLIAGVAPVADGKTIYDLTYIEVDHKMRTVQGGAVFTMPFASSVQSVKVMLMTDGRPMSARVELLQGPNNDKQIMEIFTEDGGQRPFYAVIETPGAGNVVRIVNTSSVEFPLYAYIEPYL